jgi:hypothetical protein
MSLDTQSSPGLAKRLHAVVLRMAAIYSVLVAVSIATTIFFASWYQPGHLAATPGCHKESGPFAPLSGHLFPLVVECHGFPGSTPATVLLNIALIYEAPLLAFSKMTSVIPRTAAAITMLVVWVPTIYGVICINSTPPVA